MRILHTADWHLGLRLYKKDLTQEHRLFFDWLINLIRERDIDVLLISGDIFDQGNPANEARVMYFSFLRDLIKYNCKVIITGGNHDSPGVLNAPKDILEMLNVHTIGNVTEDISQMVIELHHNNQLIAVVCAIPFIREKDIYDFTVESIFENKVEQVRTGIKNIYSRIGDLVKDNYEVPILAMGHLYAAGAELSDSERDIQVGNQSAINAEDFTDVFDYIALGHIHRPQFVAGQKHIRYSGSPIALSFSEKMDQKLVIELEINGTEINQTNLEVPAFRKLVKFVGNLEAVKHELENYKSETLLPAYAEIEIIEETTSPALFSAVSRFVADFKSDQIELLHHRITNKNEVKSINQLTNASTTLDDLSPEMVLMDMMESGKFADAEKQMILQAFIHINEMDNEED
ncbi:MAG: exonuclease subunit SbcD [Chitinophagaceae bacterium]|nr:exonuclease subunit SbcD [Chitinophagaceae bacterium]